MNITIVFKSEDKETIHQKVSGQFSIKQVDAYVRRNYTGVAYWAIGVYN